MVKKETIFKEEGCERCIYFLEERHTTTEGRHSVNVTYDGYCRRYPEWIHKDTECSCGEYTEDC